MQRHWIILLAVLSFVAGLWLAPWVYRWTSPPPPATAGSSAADSTPFVISAPHAGDRELPVLSELYEQLSPSVVNISVLIAEQRRGRRSGMDSFQPMRESRGSGLVLTPEGSVLTNHHVVAGAQRVQVQLADGRNFGASVVGSHEATDLALLQIESDQPLKLQPAVLGSSEDLSVGEWVFAIGNPFGLNHSLTTGIVSYIGRPPGDDDLLFDFIQTDTAINPGNSGGPLFNLSGEVVGISTAILGDAEGIGFCIPIDIARTVVPVLREEGEFHRGYLGVSLAANHPQHTGQGAPLAQVFDESPAALAGLQAGDVLLQLGSHSVRGPEDVPKVVALTPPGTSLQITFSRGDEQLLTTVIVGDLDEVAEVAENRVEVLGIAVRASTEGERRTARLAGGGGLTIVEVDAGGPSSRSLAPGDVIVELDYEPVEDATAFTTALRQPGRHLLLISRRGWVFPLWV